MDYTYQYETPLGKMIMASDGKALTGLWFHGQKHFGSTLDKENKEQFVPIFKETIDWLDLYFSGVEPSFTPLLSLRASAFRKAVWKVLLEIPYGQTMTYGQVASRISKQNGNRAVSAQAVGGAIAHNAILLMIPCHRVIGANGCLTGYAAGLDRKLKLLAHEGICMGSLNC